MRTCSETCHILGKLEGSHSWCNSTEKMLQLRPEIKRGLAHDFNNGVIETL